MKWFRDRASQGRPLIFAHRGDSIYAPENTLEAARRGHRSGADAWELDVRLSRDGVPIVIHDASLIRTTDVEKRFAHDPRGLNGFLVADFDWAEIQSLDAGSWFVTVAGRHRSAVWFGSLERIPSIDRDRFASGVIRIPSLAEALDLTGELDWLVNIELKTLPEGGPGLGEAVATLLRTWKNNDRVLISAFDHNELSRFRGLLPEVNLGALTITPLLDSARYVREIVGADTYHPSAESLGAESLAYRLDPRPENLWAEGMCDIPTLVYTVNDPQLARHLGEIGAAGLFSDDPSGLLRVWQVRESGNEEQRA